MKISFKQQANNAILWIEKLKYYKKTVHRLSDENGKFCCLGVGCKVMKILTMAIFIKDFDNHMYM